MTLSNPDLDFKVAVFLISNMSKLVQDRAIVTVEHCSEVLYNLSNGIISNDLE